MGKLKVLLVDTSSSVSKRIEEVLQRAGVLDQLHTLRLSGLSESPLDWAGYDLACIEYQFAKWDELASIFSEPLCLGVPPIFVFIENFDASTVLRLTNMGVRRVLPLHDLEQALLDSLPAVFNPGAQPGRLPPAQIAPASSEDNLISLVALMPVQMAIVRVRDEKCLECNDRLAKLLDTSREELLGRPLLPLDLSAEITQLHAAGKTSSAGQGLEVERKIYTSDGHEKRVRVSINRWKWSVEDCLVILVDDLSAPQPDDENVRRLNDELERLVLARTGALEAASRELAAEIGRRKSVEEISKQLEQILWQTPDFVCICNTDGSLRYINHAGRAMFHIGERQPVSELNLFEAYTPFYKRKFREEILPSLLKNGVWRGETQLQFADGKIIPVSQVMLVNREENGDVQYFASIARDISDFKRVEQELNDSREDYRTLAEAAHDYIFVMDGDGIMVYANRFACQALNLDPERVAGMSAVHFFPESFSNELLHMAAEVREIDTAVYMEGSFRLFDREFWLGTWLVPVHNSIGKLVSILGISRDISEQRKTDDALRRALENEKQINQMRSSFFSMTSHQFRTPLSTILMTVDLLQKYGSRWSEEKCAEQLARIEEAALRLHALLENILVISRVESGQFELSAKDFDLVALCDQIIGELKVNDRDAHPLKFSHGIERMMIYSDAEMLGRVIENLVSNALKYSPNGSLVHVKLSREEQLVILEVSDKGIGIPEADQKRLFQPFHRGSNTEGIHGTGIGLTIVKKSVELLNGHIFIKSREGHGTTFVVRFPANLASDRSLDRLGQL